jgi:tRNA pseudouridine55 synthase
LFDGISTLPNYPITNSFASFMNAVLIIDKPAGFTSHDVVHRARRILRQRDVGHLGTLDPMATGVLPLVLGNMTRLAQFYLASEKCYEGAIRFGFATDTYDAEGSPASEERAFPLSMDNVRELSLQFKGVIQQNPPPFSAKKVQGVPAYKLARKKKEVPLKPAQVDIKEFEIHRVEGSCAYFRARVGSGTYLRSIAHDMGQAAGCGAHLQSLRRTAVAEFQVENAHTLEEVEQAVNAESGSENLFIHPRALLPALPAVTATDEVAARIRHGQAVNLPDFTQARYVKVFCGQRDLIAIAARIAGTLFHPKIVLA